MQILLRTAQPGAAPANEVLEKYEIDFYLEKMDQRRNALTNIVKSSLCKYQQKLADQTLKDQLKKVKETAEATARSRMAFLAYMAHEIRGSLGQFAQGATLLANTNLDDRQRKLIELVRNGGEQVLDFCNDFLDHEKMNLGQMKLENRQFELRTMLEEVLAANELSLPMKGKDAIQIKLTIDPNLPKTIVADPARFRQVINNLVVNAIKFTNEGSVHVSAAPKSKNKDAIEILFLVKDTGIGIPENKLSLIFDPYIQAEDSTASLYKGTGL